MIGCRVVITELASIQLHMDEEIKSTRSVRSETIYMEIPVYLAPYLALGNIICVSCNRKKKRSVKIKSFLCNFYVVLHRN